MPQSRDHDRRAGRHAGGRQRFRFRIREAATGALAIWATWAVASVISRIIFQRDFLPVTSFGGFVTGLISFVIASVGVGVAASVAALVILTVRRRWLRKSEVS